MKIRSILGVLSLPAAGRAGLADNMTPGDIQS